MINQFFTYLGRGVQSEIGRKVSSEEYREKKGLKISEYESLVPSTDPNYQSQCMEQLLQCILNSSMSAELLQEDPENTYSSAIMDFYVDSSSISGLPADISCSFSRNVPLRWYRRAYWIVMDFSGMTAAVSTLGRSWTYSFTVEGGVTNKIPLDPDGLFLQLSGDLSGTHTFPVVYTNAFSRDLGALITDLAARKIYWSTPAYMEAFDHSLLPVERVAAAAMNLFRKMKYG